ncbi:MAG: hydroxyacylglutathione hydrolase [Peptoniphilus lacydonensis]|jgi:hydroxyacylglutathione hydrolase|uniref:hydroxyacylglutathione hydrolase n=1 Tax=Peptoniphilus lacydonensis TaxID=1673725 RepID=UPI0029024AC5|nr:hydroxyacylglutathione hydrolase [Peptoniphilus lacydonensis]MDU2115386.1 hydroxyacylglutathione hydrolase [Peptoniphilus lacydonensis]
MFINYIKAFDDNYIWTIEKDDKIIVVDPGEASPVINYLKDKNLDYILLTHKHSDHVGGVAELKNKYGSKVYGPIETKEYNDVNLKDDDEFELLGENFKVILTGGHTKEHISYLMGDNLFCGDALFLAGCGRVFTKNYKASYDGLRRLKKLDDNTKVYAAHEYSLNNLKFAKSVISNEDLDKEYEEVKNLRKEDKITLPSTIGIEKKINPFFIAKDLDEFIDFRNKKDNF